MEVKPIVEGIVLLEFVGRTGRRYRVDFSYVRCLPSFIVSWCLGVQVKMDTVPMSRDGVNVPKKCVPKQLNILNEETKNMFLFIK